MRRRSWLTRLQYDKMPTSWKHWVNFDLGKRRNCRQAVGPGPAAGCVRDLSSRLHSGFPERRRSVRCGGVNQMTFVLNESWLRSLERNICALAAAAALIGPSVALGQTGSPCEALAGRTIAPKLIGLASGPATVTSAKTERIAASPAAPEPS